MWSFSGQMVVVEETGEATRLSGYACVDLPEAILKSRMQLRWASFYPASAWDIANLDERL